MAKDKLKTDVTGDKNINAIQGGVAEGVGGQFGKGGLLNPVGQAASDQGFTRAERGDTGPVDKNDAGQQGAGVGEKAKGWGNTLTGGMLGGGGEEKEKGKGKK